MMYRPNDNKPVTGPVIRSNTRYNVRLSVHGTIGRRLSLIQNEMVQTVKRPVLIDALFIWQHTPAKTCYYC